MKKIIILFISLFFLACKPEAKNDFDEIIHYSILTEKADSQNENSEFMELYSGLYNETKITSELENKLIQFGYSKKNISKEKIAEINHCLANDLNLKYYETACVPMYRDILILNKNGKTKAMIKICFECSMNSVTGNINSNFDYESGEFSNYKNLKNLLSK